MKDPAPINLLSSEKVKEDGWAAEARDAENHLCSTQAWVSACLTNENLKMLGEFIADYEMDRTVTVFTDNLQF